MTNTRFSKKQFFLLLSTLDQLLNRFFDAVLTFLIVRKAGVTLLGHLTEVAAYYSTLLLLFICPENWFYRDFSRWDIQNKKIIASRLFQMNFMVYLKCIVFSLSILIFSNQNFEIHFSVFLLYVVNLLFSQLLGVHREYLRFSGQIVPVLITNVFQKFTRVLFIWVLLKPGATQVSEVAIATFVVLIINHFILKNLAMKQLPKTKFNKNHFFALSKRLFKVVGVQHIGSSLHGWTLGLDILALSVASIDSQWIGLYALIFKLTNFIGAIPGALLNGYQVFFAQKNSQNLFKNSINQLISALKNILILYATVALCVIFFHDPILSLLLKDQAIPELFLESKIQWIVLITFYLLIVLLGTVINNFLATKMNLFRLFMTTQLPWTITAIMACTVWYYTRIDGLSGAFSIVFGVLVAALIWLFMNILALRSYHRDQNK